MNPDILSVKGLSRSFGRKKAVDGLNFTAARGEVVGLLGRNGSGKTTFFKLILDMLDPDSGEIQAAGISPDGSGSIRQDIGYVPERPSFHNFMSVMETLKLRAAIYKKWDMQKAVSTAAKLGLRLDRKIQGMSKGETAKLAWICAVSHNPSLLLLDEADSGLDYLVKEKIIEGLIGELVSADKTIILASHTMENFMGIIDRLALISRGSVQSTYDGDTLRSSVYRVTARVRPGAAAVAGAPYARLISEDGPVKIFGVIGESGLKTLSGLEIFESVQSERMSEAEAFTLLLSGTREEL
ncbi:MAG: ABC transporter ATP-binding protein [Elusimicrobia bacterium]|nr:ABC transporter ATP-binding protein [Elusimicrobiota bacterium]